MKDPNDRRRKFWARVTPAEDGCWAWTGTARDSGYGSYAVKRRGRWTYTTAHRWAYEDQVGSIPFGYEVDHLCRARGCVRPDHLEAVTIAENRRRRDIGYAPEVDRSPRSLPAIPPPPPPAPRAPRMRPVTAPSSPRTVSAICKNGHDKRVVGMVKNGRSMTCTSCRAEQNARARKGGAHGTETHCPQGHPYTPENTYVRKRGGRECKTCVNARNRAADRRRRAEKRSRRDPVAP